jgi:DNA repair exonuclease SbcCD nuclease subunit
MRFVLAGDLHLTDRRPRFRTDADYLGTALGKLKFLLDLATRVAKEDGESCPGLMQPGDLVDSPRASYEVVTRLVKLLTPTNVHIYTTLGQHDTHFHNLSLVNTPAGLLNETMSGQVTISAESGLEFVPTHDIAILFRAWGCTLPTPDEMEHLTFTQYPNRPHVVIMHAMTTNSGKLWEGQEGNLDARTLLEDYPTVDLWVCGDNHKAFTVSVKNRHVVNCGSLMRSSIDQIDHRPRAYVWDSYHRELTRHWIPCEPAARVFDVDRAELLAERNERLELFIENLTSGQEAGTNFKDNLHRVLHSLPTEERKRVEPFIEEAMSHV